MSFGWLKCGLALACATTCALAQKSPAVLQTTPASVLMRIDEKSGEVFYHDRDNKVNLMDFVVNGKTEKSKVAPSDVVLVTYVDEGTAHIAKSIQIFSGAKSYPMPRSSNGVVGGVASNDVKPKSFASGSSLAIYTKTSTYSFEGASEMEKSIEALVFSGGRESTLGYRVKLVSVRQSGITFTALNDPTCNAVNVFEVETVESGCETDSGSLAPISTKAAYAPIQVAAGSLAYVDRISIEPQGLGVSMYLAGESHRGKYISTVWIPFEDGRLPTRTLLKKRLNELVDLSPAGSTPTAAKP